jgi:hypothetical protein
VIRFVVVLACAAFAAARFLMPFESVIDRGDFFKDAAHLFVGGLFGAGLRCGDPSSRYLRLVPGIVPWLKRRSWFHLGLAIVLTVLEVIAFKFHQH